MRVQLRFFASVREVIGMSSEVLEVPKGIDTVTALRVYLIERGGVWSDALADGRALRMAVNQQMATPETVIGDDCEVAFFPPVTGG